MSLRGTFTKLAAGAVIVDSTGNNTVSGGTAGFYQSGGYVSNATTFQIGDGTAATAGAVLIVGGTLLPPTTSRLSNSKLTVAGTASLVINGGTLNGSGTVLDFSLGNGSSTSAGIIPQGGISSGNFTLGSARGRFAPGQRWNVQ